MRSCGMWKVLNGVLNKGHKPTVLADTGDFEEDLPKNFNDHFVSIGENLTANIRQPQGTFFPTILNWQLFALLFLEANRQQ